LVVVPGWFLHVDLLWGDPGWASFVGRPGIVRASDPVRQARHRFIDPVDAVPTLESRADDLRAVLDAAGSDRAALCGLCEGGPISGTIIALLEAAWQAGYRAGRQAPGSAAAQPPF